MIQLIKLQFKLIISIIFLLFQTGCTSLSQPPLFHVDIDSIRAQSLMHQPQYVLLSALKDVNSDDLQYQEYARYIDRALSQRGFEKVSNKKDAEIAIYFSYGIGDPETKVLTYSVPLRGKTGVSGAHTSGTINSSGTTYSGTTTYTPTYGVIGSKIKTHSVTTYSRYLLLEAIDLNTYRKNKKEKNIWKTSVTSNGSSGDLRRVLPILVAASSEYISTDTEKKIRVKISESDPKVMEIKGLPFQQ
jgi:hypothetical protein